MRIFSSSRFDSACKSSLNKYCDALLLPPPSQRTSNSSAWGALFAPPEFDAFAGKLRRVAAAVQMQRCLISGKIVNAMRDDFAAGSTGEIVIVDNRRLDAVGHAVTVKIPEQFLLFRVDADDGTSCFERVLFEFSDLFELWIAVGMLSHGSILLWLATTISVFPQ